MVSTEPALLPATRSSLFPALQCYKLIIKIIAMWHMLGTSYPSVFAGPCHTVCWEQQAEGSRRWRKQNKPHRGLPISKTWSAFLAPCLIWRFVTWNRQFSNRYHQWGGCATWHVCKNFIWTVDWHYDTKGSRLPSQGCGSYLISDSMEVQAWRLIHSGWEDLMERNHSKSPTKKTT